MQRSFAYFKMQTALMMKTLWNSDISRKSSLSQLVRVAKRRSNIPSSSRQKNIPYFGGSCKVVKHTRNTNTIDTQRQSNKTKTTAQQQHKYNKINPPHKNTHTTKTLQDGQKDSHCTENIQQQHKQHINHITHNK